MFSLSNRSTFLSIPLVVLVACATPLSEPPGEPRPFDSARFCEAARDASLEIPNDITAILDNQDEHTADTVAYAALTKGALEVSHAATDHPTCIQRFEVGESKFLAELDASHTRLRDAGGYRTSGDERIAEVQQQLTWLWREDQAARFAYIELVTADSVGADFWARRLATAHLMRADDESTDYIEGLLDEFDWIDNVRFGSSVSAHAWILIQHADDRPDLQARVLERMEPYLETGGIRPANYAYLWDRVAVNTGQAQRYGTQPTWECTDGKLELQPLEQPETVNERRSALGMNSVEEGLEDMARGVCR